MQTEVKQEYINDSSQTVNLQDSTPAIQAKQTAANLDSQIQRISQQGSDFFATLPDKISRFYQEYKLPVISFGVLVVTIIVLRVGLAIIGAVNGIPLVKPFFELIGMGYTFWFTYRYLLKGSTRKKLAAELGSAKKEVVGNTASESSV